MVRPRPRDLPDDADEKWVYTDHTAAKHEILHRYLGAWLAILGRARRGQRWRHRQLVLVDAFAGRGRYVGGESGSPRIMFDRAVEVVEAGLAENVLIRCAEPNPVNFAHLTEVCARLRHERVMIKPTKETFEAMGGRLATWSAQQRPAVPIFVMVDPYGVRGVPLELLRRLLAVERLEVLLTLIVRDPSRFLKEGNYAEPLTALFGGDTWRTCKDDEHRAECLLLRFQDVVRAGVARWATPFRVFEDERRTVLYYLVHLTNHDLGMREMKKAMVKKSGDMTFWPVSVRPPDQLALDVAESTPHPTLQQHLRTSYAGRTMTFLELLNEDYPQGVWLVGQYRAALNAMMSADPPKVTIVRNRQTESGHPATRGVQDPDTVSFATDAAP